MRLIPDSTCGSVHEPISAPEAMMTLRALYAAGLGYHRIADLTRLRLSHAETRTLLQLPDLAAQVAVLEAMKP